MGPHSGSFGEAQGQNGLRAQESKEISRKYVTNPQVYSVTPPRPVSRPVRLGANLWKTDPSPASGWCRAALPVDEELAEQDRLAEAPQGPVPVVLLAAAVASAGPGPRWVLAAPEDRLALSEP